MRKAIDIVSAQRRLMRPSSYHPMRLQLDAPRATNGAEAGSDTLQFPFTNTKALQLAERIDEIFDIRT